MHYWLAALIDAVAREEARSSGTDPVVVCDIGSNDGELTVPAAAARAGTAPPVRVVAFEPQPVARSRLMARAGEAGLTMALWGAAEVTVVPLALGDRDTMIELKVFSDDSFSSLYDRPAAERSRYDLAETETIAVRMRPLDDLVAGGVVPPPGVVKIDVEGAERAVLTGARATLEAHRPPVLMEFSCPNTHNAGYARGELIDRLHALGYDLIGGLFRNEDTSLYGPHSFDDCRIWNVVAVCSATHPTVAAVATRHLVQQGPD